MSAKKVVPPRGLRDAQGQWPRKPLRPERDYSRWDNPAAARLYMELAGELTGRRYALGLSLRDLTAATGRSLSTLTSLEQGSAWPSWATLTDYATAVGTDIVVPGHEGEDVLLVLRRLMPRRIGESARAVAWAVGVSPTTLYARFREGGRPSSRVVLAVACDIGCPVLVTDALPAR